MMAVLNMDLPGEMLYFSIWESVYKLLKRKDMKKIKIFSMTGIALILLAISVNSCSSSSKAFIDSKSGAQLWGENCIRCHNTPSPAAYNDYEWETIITHMQVRANLTEGESVKILEFLKTAN
jgi:hypothetical protein